MKKFGIVALLLAMPVAATADVYLFVNPRDASYHVVPQAVGTARAYDGGRAAPQEHRTIRADARNHSSSAPAARMATDRTAPADRGGIAP